MNNCSDELVSVVIVTYNSAKTVKETIDSVKYQTYENIEIIVSDDCSSDDTVEIAKNALEEYKRWQIITSTKNQGIVNNVNKGVKNAKGKYIKLIAGDDVLLSNAIEVFYNFFIREEICVADCCFFGDDIEACNFRKEFFKKKQDFFCKSRKGQYNELLIHNPITAPSVGLLSRDLLESYGFFDGKYSMMEDYPFWVKCSKNGIRFKKIQKELVKYRVGLNSASDNRKSICFKSEKTFFFNVRFWELLKRGKIVIICKQLTYYCDWLYHLKVKLISNNQNPN